MKKFSLITENNTNNKFYKATAEIELLVNAENEGEAGYLSDSILGGIKEQIDFRISNIEETSSDEAKKLMENMAISSSNWEPRKDNLVKTFEFNSLKESIKFINHVAEIAEMTNKHPQIESDFKKVTVTIKGASESDNRIAKKIDTLVNIYHNSK